jgi:hypothetical protein
VMHSECVRAADGMRSFGSRFVTVEIERENGLILKLYFPLSAFF